LTKQLGAYSMANNLRITASMISAITRQMLANQKGLCLMCKRVVEKGTAVLDHDHATGRLRGVLHRGCNAMLGHLENNRPRHILTDEAKFREWLANAADYIYGDYENNPLHNTHKTEQERTAAAYERARKKLMKDRIAEASPEMAAAIKAKEKLLRQRRALKNRPSVKGASDE